MFSDPPLNEVPIQKTGRAVVRVDGGEIAAGDALSALVDGEYRLGFRVEHARLGGERRADALRLAGHVVATQLSGGESFVHVDIGGLRVVSLVRGIHDWATGAAAEIGVDGEGLFVFDGSGRLAAAAPGIGVPRMLSNVG